MKYMSHGQLVRNEICTEIGNLEEILPRRSVSSEIAHTKPSRIYASLHLVVVIFYLSYVALGLFESSFFGENPDDKNLFILQITRCCSNVHICLGLLIWFAPFLSIPLLALHLSSSENWNDEGTPFFGILVEYLVGVSMCSIAERVGSSSFEFASILKPRVFCFKVWYRFGNLFWEGLIDDNVGEDFKDASSSKGMTVTTQITF